MVGRFKRGLDYHIVRGRRRSNPVYWAMQFSEAGSDAIVAYEFLIDEITEQDGCLYKYDIDTLLFLICDFVKTKDLVYARKILDIIIDAGGFDKKCYEHGYLTNFDLQADFVYATQRRKARFIEGCCLLTAEQINEYSDGHVNIDDKFSDINGVIVDISPFIVNKEKQSNS